MHLTCNDIIRHQANNYYTFGGVIDEGSRRGTDVQNHLYNGNYAQRFHRQSAASPKGGSFQTREITTPELDRMHGLNLYDYSARQYDPAIGQFTSMDPLCEKYYHISPYAYCAGNPVKYVDPDGRDSIFANNIKGMVFIGDDGKNTGDVYVVTGSVRRAVKKATKRGENYSGNLRSDNDHVAVIPRGEAAKQVNSDYETAHGREEGGCRYTDGSVQKWDSGSDPVVKVNADGTIEASHSITPYKVNGKIENKGTPDVSWHIHSTLDVPYPGGSVSLGSSEPSYADYTHEKKVRAQPLLLVKEIKQFNIITMVIIQLVCHGKHGKD